MKTLFTRWVGALSIACFVLALGASLIDTQAGDRTAILEDYPGPNLGVQDPF